jgi:hypothetical protein
VQQRGHQRQPQLGAVVAQVRPEEVGWYQISLRSVEPVLAVYGE